MKTTIYIYITCVGFAFLSSLFVYWKKQLPIHLRVFLVLLGITFVVELLATRIIAITHWKNNFALYNSFGLLEFMVYAWYYYRIISIGWVRKIIRLFMFMFPLFWAYTIFVVFGFNKWNSYIILFSACFTVFFAIAYYYELLRSSWLVKLTTHSEFWIATGMLFFYSCQIPYFGTLNFLIANYKPLARSLLIGLLYINSSMYLLFAYAYLCRITTKK